MTGTQIVIAQLDAYYGGGPTTRWRDLNDGRYALDITDNDPLTNEPRAISFLFDAAPATRQFPEYRMSIVDMAVNGVRLDFREIRTALLTLATEIAPAPPIPLPQRDNRSSWAADTALRCSPRPNDGSRADFSAYTLRTLDAAFTAMYGATRNEHPGGTLDDGTPFTYITYTGNTSTRITFAVATNANDAIEVFGERDFNAPTHANTPAYADTDWYAGEAMCDDLAELLQTQASAPNAAAFTEAPVTAFSIPGLPAITAGSNYAVARQTLLNAGYQPLTFPRAGDPCVGSTEICEAYPEIVGCNGMGFNPCRFAYRAPDGAFIVGVAEGETPDHMALTGLAVANAQDTQTVRSLLARSGE